MKAEADIATFLAAVALVTLAAVWGRLDPDGLMLGHVDDDATLAGGLGLVLGAGAGLAAVAVRRDTPSRLGAWLITVLLIVAAMGAARWLATFVLSHLAAV